VARARLNWRLVVGGVLCLALLVLAVFGPYLAPYPEDYSEKLVYRQTAEGPVAVYAPAPPSRLHPLGTDRWGYDILSLLMYGARFTIFTALGVALLRMLTGAGIGLYLGLRGPPRQLSAEARGKSPLGLGALGAIPAFAVVYFIMARINIQSPLSAWELILIQGTLMVLLGLPAVAAMVRRKTEDLRNSMWVEAAAALGASRGRIGRRHILPMLKEDLLLVLVNEVILTLCLVGQLGIFDLFLGGSIRYMDPLMYVSRTHEWAGMIGQARTSLQANQWMLAGPLLAYLLAVIGFYVLLRGMEQRYRAGYHKYPKI
jgi:peptide/nickel transport system permease protein